MQRGIMALRSEELDREIKELEAGMEGTRTNSEGNEGDNVTPGQEPQKTDPPELKENVEVKPAPADLSTSQQSPAPSEDWELRFKNFKSSADDKLFNQRQQIRQLNSDNLALKNEVLGLKDELAAITANEAAKSRYDQLLSKEVTDIVGVDVAKQIATVIDSTVRESVDPLKEQLKERREAELKAAKDAEARDIQDAESRFRNSYHELIARNGFDFKTINTDKVFINTFLNSPDPITGELRRATLQRALASQDASAVARLFVEYGREKKSSFNAEVEPMGEASNPGHVPSVTDNVEDTITMKEINDFYDGGGSKLMSAEEAQAFEDRVIKLTKAGKVTY